MPIAEMLDTSHFQALLVQRREQLLAVSDVGKEAASVVELDQSRVGRLSRMDAMQAQAMSQETAHRRDAELVRIASALKRIETGDYGYCLDCGELIPSNRLDVDPAATLCIACAEKRDI